MSELEVIKVLYDGKCHLCYREIHMYKRKDKNSLLELVDIASSDFDISKHNLDARNVNEYMHAISESGEVYIGLDAFIEIWRRVPPYHRFIPLINNRLCRPVMKVLYHLFAVHIRPRLPKRTCSL